MNETTRSQTPVEKRYLRALLARERRAVRKVLWLSPISLCLGFLLFKQVDWGAEKRPLLGLALLAAMSLGPFFFALLVQARIRGINAAIGCGTVQDLRIQASAVAFLEGSKINPALHQAFALQTGPEEILFLDDPVIATSAHFPNADFSLVRPSRGRMLIVKRGTKLTPLRSLPPDPYQRPPHLSRAKGSLENLETILEEWPRDKIG